MTPSSTKPGNSTQATACSGKAAGTLASIDGRLVTCDGSGSVVAMSEGGLGGAEGGAAGSGNAAVSMGVIAGAAVGGCVALVAAAAVVVVLRRRRSRRVHCNSWQVVQVKSNRQMVPDELVTTAATGRAPDDVVDVVELVMPPSCVA